MNNLKSYTEYAVTAPTTDFVIGFDFHYGTDAVNVTVDDIPASEAGYSVIYLNSTTMRLSPAVPTGVVRLQRETDIDVPDNQFTAGAKFIASNMDENFTQIRKSQQEVRDGFGKLTIDQEQRFEDFKDSISYTELRNTVQAVNDLAEQTESYAEVVETNYENSQALLGDIETFAADAEVAADLAAAAASNAVAEVNGLKGYVDASLTAIAGGHKAYGTLAEALVHTSTFPQNSIIEITNDPTPSKNGAYQWNGFALTKSDYDPLTQAKADATTKASAAETNAKNYTDQFFNQFLINEGASWES